MKNLRSYKTACTALVLSAAGVLAPLAANAQSTPSVPTVDYTGVVSGASTYVGSLLTTNAPGIILIAVAFSGFMWLMRNIRARAAGK